jgi:hypothetical protein
MVPSGCADPSPSEENAFRQILAQHATRYPRLQVQDLYKLVYQGALGSEHAVADASQARAWLEREVDGLADGPQEPVFEPISADGQVVRVNLRPYVAGGGNLEALLEGFLRTAREYKGTIAQLKRYWSYAGRMAQAGALVLPVNELKSFFDEMQARGFPAVHHSQEYRRAYRPAYRVVVRKYLVLDQDSS